MRPFTYERAADPAGAIAAVTGADGGGSARYLGGGTNLVDLMKLEVETPARLVDVNHLGLDGIEESPDGGLLIGAGCATACWRRTPRCASAGPRYFQDVSKPCNKREPGTGCPARSGEHRNLAVLGHSPQCVATHPSDMAVAMAAFGARVHVQGPQGERTIPMPGLHRLPGSEPQRDTVLAPGELITAVELPPLPVAARSRYRKVRDRASFAFAVTSIAAALEVRDGAVADCRIAFGALAHVPWRAERAEAALRGAAVGEDAFARAADAELAPARPLRDNAFKVELARRLLAATLTELWEED
jgi:xanthine dehydrogenase YagS FAD-binding subunit